MRLVGERVTLVPVPQRVASAVIAGTGLQSALDALSLTAATGWPHADTADALRPLAADDQPDPAHGSFLITLGPELIGECGWLGGPDPHGDVEIGYGLAGSARDRGLGTEAVAVLAAWVDQQPGVRRVTADVLVGNAPSRRVLERLGFRVAGEAPPYVTYVRDAPHLDPGSNSG